MPFFGLMYYWGHTGNKYKLDNFIKKTSSLAENEQDTIHRLGGTGHKNSEQQPRVTPFSEGGCLHRAPSVTVWYVYRFISLYSSYMLFRPIFTYSIWRLVSYFLKWEVSVCSISTFQDIRFDLYLPLFLTFPRFFGRAEQRSAAIYPCRMLSGHQMGQYPFFKTVRSRKTLSQVHF